jgi:hypothetical protein
MDNSKCDCGGCKTYGEDTTLHAEWCSALKIPEPVEKPSDYPWSGGWIMKEFNQYMADLVTPSLIKELTQRSKLLDQLDKSDPFTKVKFKGLSEQLDSLKDTK